MPSDPDAALVAAVAAGDRASLAALYDRFAGRLLGLARHLLPDGRDGEDLLHDVFIEVWKQADDFDPSRGSVQAWLFTRLRTRALDRRRAHRTRPVPTVEELAGVAVPDDLAPDRAAMRRALGALPVEQRAVLALAYFEGLSSTEISTQLGIPVGTVKSRAATALGRLRAALPAEPAEGATP